MFEAAFIRTALLASVAASVPLSLYGVYLISRRMVFLGLVMANAATLGAAVATVLGWPPEATAVGASLAAALGLGAVGAPRHLPAESFAGWAYASLASLTVLVLAGATRADADTMHLLYGNLLAVSDSHAVGLVLLAVVAVLLHLCCASRFLLVTIDAEAARIAGVHARRWSIALDLSIGIAVAATVQEIGALLTFALLTLPPMAALLVTNRLRTVFAGSVLIAAASVSAALWAAIVLDLPPGPLAVAVLGLAVVAAGAVGRLTATSASA